MPKPIEDAHILRGRALTEEEKYYQEQSYKEPVAGIGRIEEAAKFLVGATATTSGLVLAAYKLKGADNEAQELVWVLPFVAWGLGIILQILVLFPMRYTVGRNHPASWKVAFQKARNMKYAFLMAGTLCFIVGIFTGLVILVSG